MLGKCSPYQGGHVAIATMHAKERALEKPLRQRLSMKVSVVSGINTDAFGTFTGEIPRAGSMADAARRKALAAITATGLPYGIGSEGVFGPNPAIPFLPSSMELLTFVDRHLGLEIRESLRTHHTNFSSVRISPGYDLSDFLKTSRFPSHALVVAPNEPADQSYFQKGITEAGALASAIADACAGSADGKACITTDMRAHMNPTRMAVIRMLARRLATRLATLCPACNMPGFGERDIERGLPCSDCSTPTDLPKLYIERCVSCAFARRTSVSVQMADPRQCPNCNP